MAWGFFVSQYLFQLFTFLLNQPYPHTRNIAFVFYFSHYCIISNLPFVLLHGTNGVGYFLQNGHFFFPPLHTVCKNIQHKNTLFHLIHLISALRSPEFQSTKPWHRQISPHTQTWLFSCPWGHAKSEFTS